MTPPVDRIFKPLPVGEIPYWRLILRGISQLCFQCNELTGLFILIGILIGSPLSFAYVLVAASIAPAIRTLLGDKRPTLETGLPALNPCLIALSLPVFFDSGWTDWSMWGLLILVVIVSVLLTKICLISLPFPTLVLPFLIVFWTLDTLLTERQFHQDSAVQSLSAVSVQPVLMVLHSLGQAIFSASIWSGICLLAGVFLSNWRHGVLVILGAIIGASVSYYNREISDPTGLNLGLYGFNGILAAVSVFVFCGGRLRLAILGAIIATVLVPVIPVMGFKTLSAPFVLTTWFLLTLGWIEEKWFLPSHEKATQ